MWPGAPHLALGWLDEVFPPQLPGQPDPPCPAVTILGKCPALLFTTVTAASSWHPEQLAGPPPLRPGLCSGSVWLRGHVLEDYLLGQVSQVAGLGMRVPGDTCVPAWVCPAAPRRPLGCMWDLVQMRPKTMLSHGLP